MKILVSLPKTKKENMRKAYTICLLSIIACLSLSSCSKDDDDDDKGTTTEEDKENVQKSLNSLSQSIANLTISDGFFAQVVDTSFIKSVLPAVYNVKGIIDIEELAKGDRFNYDSATGTYTWDATQNKWTKTEGENISFSFSSNSSEKNDCNVTVNNYEDAEYEIAGKTVYLPTSTSAVFTKDGTTLSSLSFNAKYNENGVPENVNVVTYSKPYATTTSLTQTSANSYTLSTSTIDEKSKSKTSISTSFSLTKEITDFTQITSDLAVATLTTTISQDNLSLTGTFDMPRIMKLGEELSKTKAMPTIEQINSLVSMDISYAGAAIGKLSAEKNENGTPELVITYKDGTTSNANVLLSGVIDAMTNMDTETFNSVMALLSKMQQGK